MSHTFFPLKVSFSSHFGKCVRYQIEKSLVTPKAQSTLSKPWIAEQLGGKNYQLGVVVICADLIQCVSDYLASFLLTLYTLQSLDLAILTVCARE